MEVTAAASGPLRVAVLASGNGTNLQAILDSLHGRGAVEVVGVASDKPGARALERAEGAGVATATFPAPSWAPPGHPWLPWALGGAGVVVLAGLVLFFRRRLG